MSNYLSFFKLNDDPFRMTPDTRYFFRSTEHQTALLSLDYCATEKEGFCTLTGEPGTGKTTLLRLFTERWRHEAELALVLTPRLSPGEFLQTVLEDFGIAVPSQNRNDLFRAFRDFLLAQAARGRRVAIIVDEAQEMPDATLEELRLLSNLETEREKLLLIVLSGQPELNARLLSPAFRQLNQRISIRIGLRGLGRVETADYLYSRMVQAGSSARIFNRGAQDRIFRLSGGTPRLINVLAARSMMAAFLEGTAIVTERHVRRGAQDALGSQRPAARRRLPGGGRALGTGLGVAGALVAAALVGAFTLLPLKAPAPGVVSRPAVRLPMPPRPGRSQVEEQGRATAAAVATVAAAPLSGEGR